MAQYDINFREYWRILKKRKVLVTFVTIIFCIFITFFVHFRAPTPLYRTTCVIEVERHPALKDLYNKYDPSLADDIETQITMVKSYAVFEMVVEKLGLIPQKDQKENGHLRDHVIATIENLQRKVEIFREGVSAILMIRVTDTNPIFAQKLANTVALAYRETHAVQQARRNQEQLKYIESQLGDLREKLRNAEDEVNRFAQENELVSIDLQSENLLAWAKELQKQIRKHKEEKAALNSLHSRLEAFIKNPYGSDHNFYSTEADKQYQATNDALVGYLLKRDSLLRTFTLKHPEVLAINDRILENARKMSFLLQTQIMSIQKKEADLKEELENVDRQTKVLMEKKLEFDRLKRKVDLHNEMTVLLERKNQEALIRKAEKPEIVNIVKPALLPTQPINSRNTVSAGVLSVFIGLVLGFVVAFIVETFDTSLGAIEDVEETLGTKVLGVIPQGDAQQIQEELMSRHPDKFKDYNLKHALGIITHFLPKSMISESFRALRTNIQYKDPDKRTKTLAVTSSSPEEGKSMVATNLAITMAQGGMKTLLVGSDLRKPGIDKAFGVNRAPGLTDILIGEHPWRETVKTVTDIILGKMSWDEFMSTPGLDNLHIITSGTPPQNPAELIDSKRLEEFIEEVKKEYDVIIFDSSPILSTADAAILGMKVDGVLLVYRVGSISKGLLKRTASQLEQVQGNLMGVIINGMKPDISPDFQGYKYYSYYYSYEDSEEGTSPRKTKQPLKKPLLIFAAMACLAIGFLWQSGLIDYFKRSLEGKPVKTVAVETSTENMTDSKKSVKKTTEPVTSTRPLKKPTKKWDKPAQRLEEPAKVTTAPSKQPKEGTKKLETPHQGVEGSTKQLARPTDKQIKKPPVPQRWFGSAIAPKQPVPGSQRPIHDSSKNEEPTKKLRPDGKDSKASDSIPPGNHGRSGSASAPMSGPRMPVKLGKKTPEVKAPPVQASADQASSGKPHVDAAALFSAPFFGKAGQSDLKNVGRQEAYAKYPYSIQLGSFRTLVQAKKAVVSYREKGHAAYWSVVNLDGNERWFRVYTGFFENREQAKKYREEQNLHKSLVKRTPKNVFVGSNGNEQVLKDRTSTMRPSFMPPETDIQVPNPPSHESLKQTPVKLKQKGPKGKNRLGGQNSKLSGANPSGNHKPYVADPLLGSLPINASPTAGKTKKPAEQTPVKKPLVDVAALLSAPFFGKASHLDLKKAESHEFYSRYPYSIQLDSFRTLVEAKNAVTLYREKGLFTYWCEVSPEENERWFRVYAGFFESRKQAKKYREEENLHKSLVKRTPKNALLKSLIDKPILDYQAFVKKSRPSSREENKNNKKPSILKSTEPDPVPLNKDAPPEKVGVSEQSRPKVGASSNEKAIYFWGLTPPNPRMGHSSPYTARGNLAFSHKPSSILKIPERRSEASNSNLSGISAPALAGSMPKSTLPRGVEKKGQATTDQAPPKKPSIEMSTLFSEPFFAMAIDSDLNRAGGQDAYPRYPYSIQLGSFRTLDQTRKAVESYRKKGLMAYWSEVEGEGNKRWFRVYAGFFESRAEARRYREEKSLTKSLVKKTPYSTFVGTYRDKQVLEDQTLLLKSLDYLPYAIEEQDGRYRLFVGAFLSKKVAEEKRLDLESKGIQSQVIKR